MSFIPGPWFEPSHGPNDWTARALASSRRMGHQTVNGAAQRLVLPMRLVGIRPPRHRVASTITPSCKRHVAMRYNLVFWSRKLNVGEGMKMSEKRRLAAMAAEGLIEPWEAPTHRPRKKRKPTLTSALRQAVKAGVTVAGATITEAGVQLTFGDHSGATELETPGMRS